MPNLSRNRLRNDISAHCGGGEIRTHGTLRHFGFQDRCNKPDYATPPFMYDGGGGGIRTHERISPLAH